MMSISPQNALRSVGRSIYRHPTLISLPALAATSLFMMAQPFTSAATNMTKLPTAQELNLENVNIKTAPGVSLNEGQQVIVGSVLDLFAGRPSLKKLALWTDDGEFADPLTSATGRSQYSAQWYGMQSAFSSIERLHYQVTGNGDPITMDLSTKYKVRGLGTEQAINSKINIFTNPEGKITKVEDKWDGKIPEGIFAKTWRELNSVTVPLMIKVPKNDEEDRAMGNQ